MPGLTSEFWINEAVAVSPRRAQFPFCLKPHREKLSVRLVAAQAQVQGRGSVAQEGATSLGELHVGSVDGHQPVRD